MKVSCISDIHIRSNSDEAMDLIVKFLNHDDVLSSDEVFLLGDIFDHVAGTFNEYFEKYSRFFEALERLLIKGIRVKYVEGNHDVHLQNLFANFLKERKMDISLIQVSQKGFNFTDRSIHVYLSHGDEYDLENKTYKYWKKFLISWPVGFIINNLVSFKRLDAFSKKASDDSKKRNANRDSEEHIREKFRVGSLERFAQGFNLVIGGHSHVKDYFEHKIDALEYVYVNNGYPVVDREFILIVDGKAKLVSL